MPQTRLQQFCFMFLTVLLSVASFTTYNVALSRGAMTNEVFFLALREMPVEFVIAFLLEALVAFRLAEKLAFRFVDPKRDRPLVVVMAITAMTICLMCPAMSFAATVLYDGIDSQFVANWLRKIVFNFPFAFFTQFFFIGPAVRAVFRLAAGRGPARA